MNRARRTLQEISSIFIFIYLISIILPHKFEFLKTKSFTFHFLTYKNLESIQFSSKTKNHQSNFCFPSSLIFLVSTKTVQSLLNDSKKSSSITSGLYPKLWFIYTYKSSSYNSTIIIIVVI